MSVRFGQVGQPTSDGGLTWFIYVMNKSSHVRSDAAVRHAEPTAAARAVTVARVFSMEAFASRSILQIAFVEAAG